MKLSKNLFLPIVLFFLSSGNLNAFAGDGVGSGGGGDIQCDNLIQNLTFQDPQGNLESWLQNGGPEKQSPKLDLSSSLNSDTGKPYTPQKYEKAMIALIEAFKKAPDVNCVRPGDKGYPVDVNDKSKICKSSVDENGFHMTCDRELFMALSADEKIEQDNHEFAIHVPGLEPDTGAISTYKISTQLAHSIETVEERRLVVNTSAGPNAESCLKQAEAAVRRTIKITSRKDFLMVNSDDESVVPLVSGDSAVYSFYTDICHRDPTDKNPGYWCEDGYEVYSVIMDYNCRVLSKPTSVYQN